MKLTTIVKLLKLVAPLYGVDTAKIQIVISILELLAEEGSEEKA